MSSKNNEVKKISKLDEYSYLKQKYNVQYSELVITQNKGDYGKEMHNNFCYLNRFPEYYILITLTLSRNELAPKLIIEHKIYIHFLVNNLHIIFSSCNTLE